MKIKTKIKITKKQLGYSLLFLILVFGVSGIILSITFGYMSVRRLVLHPLGYTIDNLCTDPQTIRGFLHKKKLDEYKYNDKIDYSIVRDEIIKQAKEFRNDPRFMLELAHCESGLNNLAENDKSSAEGVFQYLYATWRVTESGKKHISRFDYRANIREANMAVKRGEQWRWVDCVDNIDAGLYSGLQF